MSIRISLKVKPKVGGLVDRALDAYARRFLYPWSDGTARRKDPTYGCIDRDIQWAVDGQHPVTLGQRSVWEINLQRVRNLAVWENEEAD